jgi:hypothetical protein
MKSGAYSLRETLHELNLLYINQLVCCIADHNAMFREETYAPDSISKSIFILLILLLFVFLF